MLDKTPDITDEDLAAALQRADNTGHPELRYQAESKLREEEGQAEVAQWLVDQLDGLRVTEPPEEETPQEFDPNTPGSPLAAAAAAAAGSEPQTGEGTGEPDGGGEPQSSYQDMTDDQLKDLLKERGLPVSGNKADKITRLEEADAASSSDQGGDA